MTKLGTHYKHIINKKPRKHAKIWDIWQHFDNKIATKWDWRVKGRDLGCLPRSTLVIVLAGLSHTSCRISQGDRCFLTIHLFAQIMLNLLRVDHKTWLWIGTFKLHHYMREQFCHLKCTWPLKFELPWKEFELRIEEEDLLTPFKAFNHDMFVMPLFNLLLVKFSIFVSMKTKFTKHIKLEKPFLSGSLWVKV